MTDKILTARRAIAIHNEAQRSKRKGAIEYKRYLKQIVNDYGIEKNDVFKLAMGENLLQIVAKYEAIDKIT